MVVPKIRKAARQKSIARLIDEAVKERARQRWAEDEARGKQNAHEAIRQILSSQIVKERVVDRPPAEDNPLNTPKGIKRTGGRVIKHV